ncbi:MAG: FG-GAP repeat domain-containing protein, partial [Salinibacter sp.]
DTDGGTVKFTDVTASVAPGLTEIGLVSDALWTDFNDDGETDLLLVGEWMPITFFKNEEGQFTNVTETVGPENTKGWWNSLAAGDFDRDGDTDYVAGNLGLNTRFEASPTEPVRVHSKDFNEDGILDPIISHYMQGTSYPAHGRRELTDNLPGMLARFPANRIYAGASFEEAFTEEQLKGAHVEKAVRFETSYLENRKDGSFGLRALPMRVQTGPVFGMQTGDYNGDGHLDLLMVGNWYAPDRETGRADAFVGAFLRGDGTGHFTPVSYPKSGFLVGGDAKALATVSTGAGAPLLVATQNNDSLRVFTALRHRGKAIQVRPLDRYAMITLDGGATRKVELYYGSTYLSQSSRTLRIPPNAEKVVLHGLDGSRRVNVKTNDQ